MNLLGYKLFIKVKRAIESLLLHKEKAGILTVLFLLIITIPLLRSERLFLSSQVLALQRGGEITKEEQIALFCGEDDSDEKTDYSFGENITVDGNPLSLQNFSAKTDRLGDFLLLVNDNTLFASNSPLKTYLPAFYQHGLIVYTVQPKDTLGKIAVNFGVSLNTILWANNLGVRSIIKPGQNLIILPVSGVLHKVKKGETLSELSHKYKVPLDEIIAFNNLKKETPLITGQNLIIPGAKMPEKVSLAVLNGLKPMEESVSNLPAYPGFYLYPTSGGWNKGILHYYNAVDIINSCGSPIYAAADGLITKASYDKWYGNYVKIQHYNGTITVYGHLSTILAQEGQIVKRGDLIGKMGDTGNARGCHLHFEVRGAKNPFVLKE